MNPFDIPAEKASEKITRKHVIAIAIMAVLLMLPFAGMVYKQRADEAAKAEAARVAEIEKKAIAAMMVNLPQNPKGKSMAVKIARGTTETVDALWFSYSSGVPGKYEREPGTGTPNNGESLPGESDTATWDPPAAQFSDAAFRHRGTPGCPTNTIPVDIYIPPDMNPGTYIYKVRSNDSGGDSYVDRYEVIVQVVCMKVTIRGITPATP